MAFGGRLAVGIDLAEPAKNLPREFCAAHDQPPILAWMSAGSIGLLMEFGLRLRAEACSCIEHLLYQSLSGRPRSPSGLLLRRPGGTNAGPFRVLRTKTILRGGISPTLLQSDDSAILFLVRGGPE